MATGRQPGFGLTVDIIHGGVECNQPTPDCQIFRVAPASDLYFGKRQSY